MSVFMAFVAAQNFRSVDRLLANPGPQAGPELQKLGPDQSRLLLRYQVSEQNRWYFEQWESAQMGIGILLFFIVLFATTSDKVTLLLSLALIVVVIVQKFFVTPNITALGRVIDFVPQGAPSAERTRFWMFHSAYSSLEIAKWVIGLFLAAKLLVRSRRSHHPSREVDLVDEADDRHVNR